MVKTWGIIFPKKPNIEDSIRKWLREKYDMDLNISERSKSLLEESYEKQKDTANCAKFQALLTELNK